MAYVIKNWTDGDRVYAVDINRWEKGIDDVHKEKLDKTSYTASDVLTKLKTVHGSNSGLDADLLDGRHATYFATATALTEGLNTKLNASSYTAGDVLAKLKTVDGTNSGLDADLLDGLHASDFSLKDHSHAWASIIGRPSTFSPSTHSHPVSEVTGLQTALDGKSDTSHAHTWDNITGKPTTFTPSEHNQAWTTITGKPSTFPPSSHVHAYGDLTGRPISYGSTVPSTLKYQHIFVKV